MSNRWSHFPQQTNIVALLIHCFPNPAVPLVVAMFFPQSLVLVDSNLLHCPAKKKKKRLLNWLEKSKTKMSWRLINIESTTYIC